MGCPPMGGHHKAKNWGCPDTLDTNWIVAYGMTHGMTPTPLFLSVCQPLGLWGSDIYVTGDENENGNYPNDKRSDSARVHLLAGY